MSFFPSTLDVLMSAQWRLNILTVIVGTILRRQTLKHISRKCVEYYSSKTFNATICFIFSFPTPAPAKQ